MSKERELCIVDGAPFDRISDILILRQGKFRRNQSICPDEVRPWNLDFEVRALLRHVEFRFNVNHDRSSVGGIHLPEPLINIPEDPFRILASDGEEDQILQPDTIDSQIIQQHTETFLDRHPCGDDIAYEQRGIVGNLDFPVLVFFDVPLTILHITLGGHEGRRVIIEPIGLIERFSEAEIQPSPQEGENAELLAEGFSGSIRSGADT